MINGIGGVQVLFPLLEQVQYVRPPDLVPKAAPPLNPVMSPSSSDEFGKDEWVVVPSSSYAGRSIDMKYFKVRVGLPSFAFNFLEAK